jgi:phenylacetic acid degradation operon negative regulatory protein
MGSKVVGVKARSAVFDLFGDYLRYRGGEVRLRDLSALMLCFDVPDTTVRVVVTRMRREGWLEGSREGRGARIRLTQAAWDLLDEGRARIFRRSDGTWDGRWHMAIYSVPESERAVREQLRKRLAWLGFGPLTGSVWVSPHDRTGALVESFADDGRVKLRVFRSRSLGRAADLEIAAGAWDLAAIDRDYQDLLARYRPRLAAYRAGEVTGQDALVERMRLTHDYRMFPFRDPDLPRELLPADWSGRDAHEVFLEAHGLLRAPAEEYVDSVLGTVATPH